MFARVLLLLPLLGHAFQAPPPKRSTTADEALSAFSDEDYVQIPASCNNIELDGLYYVKPSADGPVIPVLCSHGFTMIDPSLDVDMSNIAQYLSTYVYAIRDEMNTIIPDMAEQISFREWWTPSDDGTSFHVALGCESCESTASFGDNSVYYTSSFSFCFAQRPSDGCEAALSISPYACNTCATGEDYDKCTAVEFDADAPIKEDHDQCLVSGLSYRPVMSMVRDACTCYKPSDAIPQDSYAVLISELPPVQMDSDVRDSLHHVDDAIIWYEEEPELPKDMQHCYDTIRYLTNQDFKYGTLRIQECGTYVLAEDIVLNFNAPDDQYDADSSPNSIDDESLNWYPSREQQETYPGTYNFEGSYTLGFFAGITVEADYVSIDLNGHTLEQSHAFYLQQRYFALISLSAKYFLPNQGPSNWLMKEQFFPSHVEIFGGTLGLTSHHGIFALAAEHLFIHDIDITRFETHGIQCNGCNHFRLERATVGPMLSNIPVLGRYTLARAMLPRFQALSELYGDERMKYAYMEDGSEGVLISDMVDRLINQMDMMYHSVINNVVYDEDDAEWMAAKKLFYNPTGWMDGGSTYGIVVNGLGSAVRGIGYRKDGSSDIKFRDVEVYGIYNQVREKMQTTHLDEDGTFTFGSRTRLAIFDTIDWEAVVDQMEDGATVKYVGDAYTDLIWAIHEHVTSWNFLHALVVNQAEVDFATNGAPFRDIWGGGSPAANDQSGNGCCTDILLHSIKGSMGVRFDGTEQLDVDGLYIHDVVNWADLGKMWCGEYDYAVVRDEQKEIQYGYTGTRSNGLLMSYTSGKLANVRVENVESYHGEANGVVLYKNCHLEFSGVSVDTVNAGSQMTSHEVAALTKPNLTPKSCAVDIHDATTVVFTDVLKQRHINGFEDCVTGPEDSNVLSDKNLNKKANVNVSRYSGLAAFVFPAVLIWLSLMAYVCLHTSVTKLSSTTAECTPLLN